MRHTDYVVRVQLIGKDNRFRVVEKSFKTEAARAKWLEKKDANDELFQILAFSDPQ